MSALHGYANKIAPLPDCSLFPHASIRPGMFVDDCNPGEAEPDNGVPNHGHCGAMRHAGLSLKTPDRSPGECCVDCTAVLLVGHHRKEAATAVYSVYSILFPHRRAINPPAQLCMRCGANGACVCSAVVDKWTQLCQRFPEATTPCNAYGIYYASGIAISYICAMYTKLLCNCSGCTTADIRTIGELQEYQTHSLRDTHLLKACTTTVSIKVQ